MFINKIKYFIISIFLISSNILFAEDIIEIIDLAFKNSYEFQSNVEKYNLNYANKGIANSYLLPTIDLTASYDITESSREYKDSSLNTNTIDTKISSNGLSITLSQPLINVAAWELFSSGRLVSEAAFIELEKDKNSIILKAVELYFNVLSAKDDVEYNLANKQYLIEQMDDTKARIKVGQARPLDIEEVKSKYELVLYQEILYENNLKIALDQLEQFLNHKIQTLHKVKENLDNINIEKKSVEDWQDLSKKNNLDILAYNIRLKIADNEISAVTSTYYPNLYFVASYNINNSSDANKVPGSYSDYSSNSTYLGLKLNMNLFSGGKNYYERKQKVASKKQIDLDLRSLEQTINNLTMQYYLNVYSGITQLEALKQSVIAGEKFLLSARKAYSVGLQTNTEVLIATENYFNSKRNFTKAKYKFLLSALSLKAVSGTITNDDLVKLNYYLEK